VRRRDQPVVGAVGDEQRPGGDPADESRRHGGDATGPQAQARRSPPAAEEEGQTPREAGGQAPVRRRVQASLVPSAVRKMPVSSRGRLTTGGLCMDTRGSEVGRILSLGAAAGRDELGRVRGERLEGQKG
jgi:hypothetical protein